MANNSEVRKTTFKSSSDIDNFFKKLSSSGYADWFNKNHAGKNSFGQQDGHSSIKISKPSSWSKVWNNISTIYGKDEINLVEFLAIDTIMLNETGGTFEPITESVGNKSNPGISYAFNSISGLKKSYNTLDTNKTAKKLFNDQQYIKAHGLKPFGTTLKNTTDPRWDSSLFPSGFSGGNTDKETDKSGSSNTFITESDFFKFRGRGFIQTTGRSNYNPIVKFILSYNGSNSNVLKYKNQWSQYNGNVDTILTISTNKDWDELFFKTDFIIACYAVYTHAKAGGNYQNIDAGLSDSNLRTAFLKVAKKIAGGGASAYHELYLDRVYQQLDDIENKINPDEEDYTDAPGASQEPTPEEQDNASQEGSTAGDGSNSGQNNNPSGVSPTLTNIFKPSIKVGTIDFDMKAEKSSQEEVADSFGYTPVVWYNNIQIRIQDIQYFALYGEGILPEMKMTFYDSVGFFEDKGFPMDDSKIKVFINSRNTNLKPIFMDFKITDFSFDVQGNYTLSGVADIPRIYLNKFESFSQMTSHEALQKLIKECELGFNTNTDTTSDKMTWINPGIPRHEFIQNIISRSYKSDTAFMWGYVDFYYNFNYLDVEKELNRNINEELGVSSNGMEEIFKVQDKNKLSSLFLTNDESMESSNSYFSNFRVINKSTNKSLKNGYRNVVKYYDELNKDVLVFHVESNTSKDKIILKGAPNDDSFFKEHTINTYIGKIDTDNLHKNYHYTKVQNVQNIEDLQKMGLIIKMPTSNFNLYRFQKVKLYVSNQAPNITENNFNARVSGEWIISSINFIMTEGKFFEEVKLVRRDLDMSDDELGDQEQQSNADKNKNSSNNSVNESNNPNSTSGTDVQATNPDTVPDVGSDVVVTTDDETGPEDSTSPPTITSDPNFVEETTDVNKLNLGIYWMWNDALLNDLNTPKINYYEAIAILINRKNELTGISTQDTSFFADASKRMASYSIGKGETFLYNAKKQGSVNESKLYEVGESFKSFKLTPDYRFLIQLNRVMKNGTKKDIDIPLNPTKNTTPPQIGLTQSGGTQSYIV